MGTKIEPIIIEAIVVSKINKVLEEVLSAVRIVDCLYVNMI